MNESSWLENMVVLGQGAPNQIKKIDRQQGRCLCLWSEKTGFVRVYPIPYGYVHDWEIINVEVRKPTNDGRGNSFVVSNYENEWNNLSKRIYVNKEGDGKNKKLTRSDQIGLLEKLPISTFSEIRDEGKSFGLIKPKSMKFILEKKIETSQAQTTLSEDGYLIMNQKDFAFIPSLEYECECLCNSKHPHKQSIVEWGAYQFMRKNPNSEEYCMKLKENFHIGDEDYLHYILIGNIKKYPKTYIIIKLIRFKVKED